MHGPSFASVIISALGFVGLLHLEESWEVLVVTDIDEEERELDAAASGSTWAGNDRFSSSEASTGHRLLRVSASPLLFSTCDVKEP